MTTAEAAAATATATATAQQRRRSGLGSGYSEIRFAASASVNLLPPGAFRAACDAPYYYSGMQHAFVIFIDLGLDCTMSWPALRG